MSIITLLDALVAGLDDAGEKFYSDPTKFGTLEESVLSCTNRFAAEFLSMVLTEMDEFVCENSKRKSLYTVHKHDQRTLITTAGDVTFQHTLFKSREDGSFRYILDDMLHLPDHERFSTRAESVALYESQVHSYQHAADSLEIGNQKVSRTAIMNKVHEIEKEDPSVIELPQSEKKRCEYLYIEADEDHIAAQNKEGRGMIGKLIYLFEGKTGQKGERRELINPHYFSGLYEGSAENAKLWNEVQRYIETHYQTSVLKTVYISGDGGAWIKAGVDYIDRSVFVCDRFHLMKYINRVSNFTLDERDITKGRFYKYIYKDRPIAAKKLLTRIQNACEGSDQVVEACRSYFFNNWDAIQRAFHDEHVLGCSAEGHVSNVLSNRLSSRPMGWSKVGADRMCRLRCFVQNNPRERIIDLVEYRREKLFQSQQIAKYATGTDGMIETPKIKDHYSKQCHEAQVYAERMRVTIGGGTVRKTLAIREQIGNI